MKTPLRSAGLLWLAVLFVVACVRLAAAGGYAHATGGFPGHFEADASRRLLVDAQGDGFVALLQESGVTWQIAARKPNDLGVIAGSATSGKQTKSFAASWENDDLLVTLGDKQTRFIRTAELNPKLADLGAVRTDPSRLWTLAIYLGGDNDLEAAALEDLQEMRDALPARGVEVIVLLDRAKGYADNEGNWTGARVLRIQPGGKPETLLRDLGEIDTGDASTLGSFLTGAFRTFPARHHAAIIWDHGGGWSGIVVDEDVPGHPGKTNMLNLADVRVGLRTAILHATHRPLDIVAFDACLMAQLEVALQIHGCADYMIASQAVEPGDGYPYRDMLPLFARAGSTPRQIAIDMTEVFGKSYTSTQREGTTVSAIDLAQAPAVAEALDSFAFLSEVFKEQYWPAVLRALFYAEAYDTRSERLLPAKSPSVDIKDFVHRVAEGMKPLPLDKWVDQLDEALDRAVIATHNGDHRSRSHGLAIYGPRTEKQYNAPAYGLSPLREGASSWLTLIKGAQLEAAKHAKEDVVFSDVSVYASLDAEGKPLVTPFDADAITFTLTGNSIVQVVQVDLQRDGEGWVVLRRRWVPDPLWMTRAKAGATDLADLFMPMFKDGENKLAIELTAQRFVVSNGETSSNLTLDMSNPTPGAPYITRGQWHRANDKTPVDVEVAFDPIMWTVIQVNQLGGDPAITNRAVEPGENDSISFLLETIDDDGKNGTVATPAMRWAKGPSLIFYRDDPGEYHTLLAALTLDGRQFTAGVDYSVQESAAMTDWADSWKDWDPETLKGGWRRHLIAPDGTLVDLESPAFVKGNIEQNKTFFEVENEVTIDGETHKQTQLWLIQGGPVPSLRIIQPVADGPDLCWYGPVRLGQDEKTPWIAMKALQVGGLIWRWDRSILESLRLRPAAPGKNE